MHIGACVTTWRNVTPERGSLAVRSFRWRVTPNHRWIQQSRHDGRSASKPSFISTVDQGRGVDGKAGGHIIRLALAYRAPSSFSAVILDRAGDRFHRAASRIALRCVALRSFSWYSLDCGLWCRNAGRHNVLFRRTKIILGHCRARHEI